jgi:hypothetical protein
MDIGWCQLRRLPIERELASALWCHHWTPRPPRLPAMGDGPESLLQPHGERQLALTDVLES